MAANSSNFSNVGNGAGAGQITLTILAVLKRTLAIYNLAVIDNKGIRDQLSISAVNFLLVDGTGNLC